MSQLASKRGKERKGMPEVRKRSAPFVVSDALVSKRFGIN